MSVFSSSNSKTEKISVIAQIRAKSGSEAKVRAIAEGLAAPSLKEPGCIAYRVFEDKHYTGSFFTYEEWESEAALDEHLKVNKEGLNNLKSLLQEELRIDVLKPIA